MTLDTIEKFVKDWGMPYKRESLIVGDEVLLIPRKRSNGQVWEYWDGKYAKLHEFMNRNHIHYEFKGRDHGYIAIRESQLER